MIDYGIISNSISFYESKGFNRVEVPWTVTKGISDITKPKDAKDFQLVHEDGKVLVASAEQSFLYQYAKGFLPKGRFQAITPCFRKESFDAIHTKYFIKNELIVTDDVSKGRLDEVVDIASEFFEKQISSDASVRIVETKIGYDIEINGVEVGSYGIRSCDFLTWIYATGVAEPRLSSLIQKYGRISQTRNP